MRVFPLWEFASINRTAKYKCQITNSMTCCIAWSIAFIFKGNKETFSSKLLLPASMVTVNYLDDREVVNIPLLNKFIQIQLSSEVNQ